MWSQKGGEIGLDKSFLIIVSTIVAGEYHHEIS